MERQDLREAVLNRLTALRMQRTALDHKIEVLKEVLILGGVDIDDGEVVPAAEPTLVRLKPGAKERLQGGFSGAGSPPKSPPKPKPPARKKKSSPKGTKTRKRGYLTEPLLELMDQDPEKFWTIRGIVDQARVDGTLDITDKEMSRAMNVVRGTFNRWVKEEKFERYQDPGTKDIKFRKVQAPESGE